MNANPLVINNIRSETLATRLSTAEMCAVEAAAAAAGIRRSEWLREAVLAHLDHRVQPSKLSSESVLLAEIMGLRLMMFEPISRRYSRFGT
jgi:hypothetical protein